MFAVTVSIRTIVLFTQTQITC